MHSTSKPPVDRKTIDALRRLSVEALRTLPRGEIPVSHETASMAPLFRGGEVLCWERPKSPPSWGDIVVFVGRLHDGESGFPRPIVHRVLGFRSDGLLRTKGDARPWFDLQGVPQDDVLGVVVSFRDGSSAYDLTTRRARFYGKLVGAVSLVGAWKYKAAALLDAALRRTIPGFADRRFFRLMFDVGQRLSQRGLYALLFRFCHRAQAAGREREHRS